MHRLLSTPFVAVAWALSASVFAAEPAATATKPRMELVAAIEQPKTTPQVAEKDLGGYLMVYFKDQTHSAYFAISRDGETFADINGGQPVFNGADLAEQKGVRERTLLAAIVREIKEKGPKF